MTPVVLIVATGNAHKTDEFRHILGGGIRCIDLKSLPDAPAAVEDADTFAGNAVKKAASLAGWLSNNPGSLRALPEPSPRVLVVADDSGLEVDALNGAPGVLSARFAAHENPGGGNAPDSANNTKLLRLLDSVPDSRRTARFRCALALMDLTFSPFGARATSQPQIFEGVCEGTIRRDAAGAGGFGYDPLFVPDGHRQSFAELGAEIKNAISHRAHALAKLREYLTGARA